MGRLDGKVAIVTGAGAGIGRATALRLAAEGARVVVAEIQSEQGKASAEAIEAAGAEALFVATDVTQAADVVRLVEATLERFGRIDVLVNCAGGSIPSDGDITEVDLDAVWDHTLSLALKGTMLCCRHVIPHMLEAGGGSIVLVGSQAMWLKPPMPQIAYAASKGALLSAMYHMAEELGPDKIRVNMVAPGVVRTPLHAGVEVDDFGGIALLQRVGEVEEITEAVLYLTEAAFVTGHILPVDGGFIAGRA